MSEINWIKQGDDYSAKVAECDLLVEQNELYKWWYWQIDGKGTYYNGWQDTLEQAKEAATQAYLESINK